MSNFRVSRETPRVPESSEPKEKRNKCEEIQQRVVYFMAAFLFILLAAGALYLAAKHGVGESPIPMAIAGIVFLLAAAGFAGAGFIDPYINVRDNDEDLLD